MGRQDQTNLFGPAAERGPALSPEMLALVRGRLMDELARIKAAAVIAPDDFALVKSENFFRYNKDMLPPEEAAALWTRVDVEMDRLYAALDDAPG